MMLFAFVTALVHHSAGRIKAYEMWNESNWYLFWGGTAQQLAHLTDLAAPVIRSGAPGASVVTLDCASEGETNRRATAKPHRSSLIAGSLVYFFLGPLVLFFLPTVFFLLLPAPLCAPAPA